MPDPAIKEAENLVSIEVSPQAFAALAEFAARTNRTQQQAADALIAIGISAYTLHFRITQHPPKGKSS